jgi:predicted  nucleic acid-binding Zn-ribbon protein
MGDRKGRIEMDKETYKSIKEALQRELESLRQTGEELKLQATLARADLRADWQRLETRLALAQEEVTRLSDHTKSTAREIEQRTRALIEEIKSGYERIRNAG